MLLFGLSGGLIRTFELRFAYDSFTGLAPANHILTVALYLVTAAAVVVCLALSMRGTVDDSSRNLNGARLPLIVAAFILGCACAVDFANMLRYDEFSVIEIIMAALGILTAFIMVLMAATITSKATHGLYATVAVFWLCAWLLILFADNAGNPVFGQFWYEFMAVIFSAFAFYIFAGIHFNKPRPRMLTFTAGVAVFFLMTALVGPVLAQLLYKNEAFLDGVTSTGQLRLLFALIYIMCMPTLARRVRHMPETPPHAQAQAQAQDVPDTAEEEPAAPEEPVAQETSQEPQEEGETDL